VITMEIVTTCSNCWQPSTVFPVNTVAALTIMSIAICERLDDGSL
jgi:hypothetical protein